MSTVIEKIKNWNKKKATIKKGTPQMVKFLKLLIDIQSDKGSDVK